MRSRGREARSAITFGAIALAILGTVSVDIAYTDGSNSAAVFMACAIACFVFAVGKGKIMTNDIQPVVEAEVPGIGKLRAQGVFGDRALLVIVIAGVAVSLYWHDSSGREDTRKILAELVALREATTENTYVLSLSQTDRERLTIVMPESLRRKLRKADP